MIKRLTILIEDSLEEQGLLDLCKLEITGDPEQDIYEVNIIADEGCMDEFDEGVLYDAIASSHDFENSEVLLNIKEKPSSDDELETDEDEDEGNKEEDAEETEDGLHIKKLEEIEEDEEEEDQEDEEAAEQLYKDCKYAEYDATWKDLEDFESEFGDDYGNDERDRY